MNETTLVDRLAQHRILSAAPREELEWLASNGSIIQLDTGELLTAKRQQVRGFFAVLSGHLAMTMDRGAGPSKAFEWRDGDVTGLLPYSRLVTPPGDVFAQEPSTLYLLKPDKMSAMIHDAPGVTSILVHVMIDRTRMFTSADLHDEKMVSLGKLSAGLAHELNNPASAIERSAALLKKQLEESERATRALAASNLTSAQLAALDAVRESCPGARVRGVRSPIEQAEHEEALADWLADHGVDVTAAEALAETTVSFEALDALADAVRGPALDAAVRWVAAGCSIRGIASEIQDAANRVSGLVAAVKGFTHMDQATVAEPVDLARGLDNTIAVLRSKARSKSITVNLEVEAGLPRVRGFAGELNQIWVNLIDNALDAAPNAGRVDLLASRDRNRVVVQIIDNGAGIPADIRDRVFEPFFTTKPVGQGTGLGLDIVVRLVRHNEGEITVESRPGRTEFRVTLPVAEAERVGGKA
jgi:signal transduction histidine kinase